MLAGLEKLSSSGRAFVRWPPLSSVALPRPVIGLSVIILAKKTLSALEATLYRISGQACESGGPDVLSNYHTVPADVAIACLSVVVSFIRLRVVPITFFAILELSSWPKPFVRPVVMLFGYVVFHQLRRLRALFARRRAHALGLGET